MFSSTEGKIIGRVLSPLSYEPLPSVNVILYKEGKICAEVSTDHRGVYTITNVKPGEYDLEFSLDGYDSITVTGTKVSAGGTTLINAKLIKPCERNLIREVFIEPHIDFPQPEPRPKHDRPWPKDLMNLTPSEPTDFPEIYTYGQHEVIYFLDGINAGAFDDLDIDLPESLLPEENSVNTTITGEEIERMPVDDIEQVLENLVPGAVSTSP